MDPIRRHTGAAKVALAKHMRRNQTSLERFAWSLLRNRGILGLKFRRQHILLGFIVDFVSLRARLIVEVDGPHHAAPAQGKYDRARCERLAAAGFTVLRLRARELTRERLADLLRPHVPRMSPLSRRERGLGGEDPGDRCRFRDRAYRADSRGRLLIRPFGLLVVLAAGLALAPAPAAVCDPVWLPISRPPDAAFFVATPIGGHAAATAVQLQAGKLSTGAPLARGPALLVPWAYGPDCAAIAWDSATAWALSTEPAFFTGVLRPRSKWIDHRPTFDVAMAWAQPLWRVNDPRWAPRGGEPLLNPDEFLQFYEQLPTHDAWLADPDRAAARTASWAAGHPAIAAREPARTILENLRRAASQ